MEQLAGDEVQVLITLLSKIPDIHRPGERYGLLAGLSQDLINVIPVNNSALSHLTSIVTTLGSEAYFRLNDGTYPIITVIRNAQRKVGEQSSLFENLQGFLDTLCQQHSIANQSVPLILSEKSLNVAQKAASHAYKQTTQNYGAKLKAIADMLWHEDLFTLTEDSFTFKTIIAQLKAVAEGLDTLKDLDNVNIDLILNEIYDVISRLHIAGERSLEQKFAIRIVRYEEFKECYRRLKALAALLVK